MDDSELYLQEQLDLESRKIELALSDNEHLSENMDDMIERMLKKISQTP